MNKNNQIGFDVINDKELLKLFGELQVKVQNRIINAGFRKAGNVIYRQAKQNFNSVKKNKSKTNYKEISKAFKMQPIKNPNKIGVIIGVKHYKARWIEYGTEDRYYVLGKKRFFANRKSLIEGTKNKHFTGKLPATHFFYNAVTSRKAEAQSLISKCIVDSMNNIVSKYENR